MVRTAAVRHRLQVRLAARRRPGSGKRRKMSANNSMGSAPVGASGSEEAGGGA